jgi:molybdenum cofactor cytidylyltransferase
MTGGSQPGGFVSSVILAAGASVRMGRPKLAIPVRGEPMIRRVTRAAIESRCREVIVVLGTDADVYRPMLDGLAVRIVVNPAPAEGMGSSLRTGIAAVSAAARAAVVLLADQPLVTPEIIDHLIEGAAASHRRIVASAYDDTMGPPVYFDRAYFRELLTLEGDRGARSVIMAHPEDATALPLPETLASDVDTARDLSSFDG